MCPQEISDRRPATNSVLDFKPSNPEGIGIEIEFQLLDAQTLDLVDGILPLMELISDNPYIKPEFIQNTVEVASKVCYSLPELETHVLATAAELNTNCQQLGMMLCATGTHPFSRQLGILTPLPRYLRMEKQEGYLSHVQITFALHVHIGMGSGNEAIRIMRELKPYLSLLIALSASSPFWRGYDTCHVSYRQRILAATRSYGIPPAFSSWEEFSDFADVTRRSGIFETINDIHWDIRPRPHLGSLEIRVYDVQPTVRQSIILAGLVRVLVQYLRERHAAKRPCPEPLFAPLPWWIEKINHYQASHLGLSAQYIVDNQGSFKDLKTLFDKLSKILEPVAENLDQGDYLRQLQEIVAAGVSAQRQRAIYQQTGSMKQVVACLAAELEQEIKYNKK